MDETVDVVREAIAEIAKVDAADLSLSMRFDVDLDTDSLDLYDVVNIIENRLQVRVEDRELYDLESIEDLVALVDRLRANP